MRKVVSIKQVKETPSNPRLIKDAKFKKLVKSIKEDGWMMDIRPIVVDETMTVLGGNMRIKDNSGFGEWDWDLLANEWDVKQLTDWGVDLPVFDLPIDDEPKEVTDDSKEVCELCGK